MAYANSPFWDAVGLLEKTLEDLEKLRTGWGTYSYGLAPKWKERLAKIDATIVDIEVGLKKLRPVSASDPPPDK